MTDKKTPEKHDKTIDRLFSFETYWIIVLIIGTFLFGFVMGWVYALVQEVEE